MTQFAAFDLATTSACCYGRPNAPPTVEAVRAPGGGTDYGPFAAFYFRWFNRILDRVAAGLAPDEEILVAYEAPILMGAGKRKDGSYGPMTTVATTRRLHSLGVILEMACEMHPARTDVRECNVRSIKKRLTGDGGADKGAMVLAARRAGIILPEGREAMDGADSFAVFIMCVEHHAPEHLDYWLRKIHGQGLGQERMSAAEARKLL